MIVALGSCITRSLDFVYRLIILATPVGARGETSCDRMTRYPIAPRADAYINVLDPIYDYNVWFKYTQLPDGAIGACAFIAGAHYKIRLEASPTCLEISEYLMFL